MAITPIVSPTWLEMSTVELFAHGGLEDKCQKGGREDGRTANLHSPLSLSLSLETGWVGVNASVRNSA